MATPERSEAATPRAYHEQAMRRLILTAALAILLVGCGSDSQSDDCHSICWHLVSCGVLDEPYVCTAGCVERPDLHACYVDLVEAGSCDWDAWEGCGK